MCGDMLVRTVDNLGRSWVWHAEAGILSINAGLTVDQLADALEEAAALLRLQVVSTAAVA